MNTAPKSSSRDRFWRDVLGAPNTTRESSSLDEPSIEIPKKVDRDATISPPSSNRVPTSLRSRDRFWKQLSRREEQRDVLGGPNTTRDSSSSDEPFIETPKKVDIDATISLPSSNRQTTPGPSIERSSSIPSGATPRTLPSSGSTKSVPSSVKLVIDDRGHARVIEEPSTEKSSSIPSGATPRTLPSSGSTISIPSSVERFIEDRRRARAREVEDQRRARVKEAEDRRRARVIGEPSNDPPFVQNGVMEDPFTGYPPTERPSNGEPKWFIKRRPPIEEPANDPPLIKDRLDRVIEDPFIDDPSFERPPNAEPSIEEPSNKRQRFCEPAHGHPYQFIHIAARQQADDEKLGSGDQQALVAFMTAQTKAQRRVRQHELRLCYIPMAVAPDAERNRLDAAAPSSSCLQISEGAFNDMLKGCGIPLGYGPMITNEKIGYYTSIFTNFDDERSGLIATNEYILLWNYNGKRNMKRLSALFFHCRDIITETKPCLGPIQYVVALERDNSMTRAVTGTLVRLNGLSARTLRIHQSRDDIAQILGRLSVLRAETVRLMNTIITMNWCLEVCKKHSFSPDRLEALGESFAEGELRVRSIQEGFQSLDRKLNTLQNMFDDPIDLDGFDQSQPSDPVRQSGVMPEMLELNRAPSLDPGSQYGGIPEMLDFNQAPPPEHDSQFDDLFGMLEHNQVPSSDPVSQTGGMPEMLDFEHLDDLSEMLELNQGGDDSNQMVEFDTQFGEEFSLD
ncbi:Uu.00g140770.m01.CDS01 [Anthostomella pinea]|uniref:Uu.00g140770.m01.CDS01 n=1 Tax=Anthostomella pinea TaxID=933095 RepID=A0AAI8VQ91_9PEZI|nr:Uu.00g140770.m01.CDS01 [Anthostomella pinea]